MIDRGEEPALSRESGRHHHRDGNLDLHRADVTAEPLGSGHATLIGGQLHMLVPEGVKVVVTAARHSSRVGPDLSPRPGPAAPAGPAGSPLIEIRTFSVGGQVRVHTPRRPSGRWLGRRPR